MSATRDALAGRIFVGAASWSDPGFVAQWYPPKLPAHARLAWYAEHFSLVEVNSSFYAVPDARLVRRWCEETPDEFVFDLKLHRFLSRHATTLKSLPPVLQRGVSVGPRGSVAWTPKIEAQLIEIILAAIEPLRAAKKFGAFLLQLSPAFSPRKHELRELDSIFEKLGSLGVAVELRNRNWLEGEERARTLKFFREQKITLALVDAPNEKHFTIMPSDCDAVTQPALAYLRLHGRDAQAYLKGKTVAERFYYDYNEAEIEELAQRARRLAREAKKVHVIFNNNALDFAPHAAARMRAALGQLMSAPARQAELFR